MIGLDTNVLVRYLTWDDPDQAEKAAAVIGSSVDAGTPIYLSSIVLCEVVWVLEGAYSLSRDQILDALEAILRTAQFEFGDKGLLWAALADFRSGSADFADYVIGREGVAAGCDRTISFDRSLMGSPLFEVI